MVPRDVNDTLRHQRVKNVIFGHSTAPRDVNDILQHQSVKNVLFGPILYFIKCQPLPHSVIKYLDTLRCQRVKNVVFRPIL